MRYRLRTLLIVAGLGPAIIWAITVGIANYLELRGPPAYKAASEQRFTDSHSLKPKKLTAPK
jgi:hypothetical protein